MAVSKRQIRRITTKINSRKTLRYKILGGIHFWILHKISKTFIPTFTYLLHAHQPLFITSIASRLLIGVSSLTSQNGGNRLASVLCLQLSYIKLKSEYYSNLQKCMLIAAVMFIRFRYSRHLIFKKIYKTLCKYTVHNNSTLGVCGDNNSNDINRLILNAIFFEHAGHNNQLYDVKNKITTYLTLQWDRHLWAISGKRQSYFSGNFFKYSHLFRGFFFSQITLRTRCFIAKIWLLKTRILQLALWVATPVLKLKHLFFVLRRVRTVTYKFSWVYYYGLKKLRKLLTLGIAIRWSLINITLPFKHFSFFITITYFLRALGYSDKNSNNAVSTLFFNIWRLSNTLRLLFLLDKRGLAMLALSTNNKKRLISTRFFLHNRYYPGDFLKTKLMTARCYAYWHILANKSNLVELTDALLKFSINLNILFYIGGCYIRPYLYHFLQSSFLVFNSSSNIFFCFSQNAFTIWLMLVLHLEAKPIPILPHITCSKVVKSEVSFISEGSSLSKKFLLRYDQVGILNGLTPLPKLLKRYFTRDTSLFCALIGLRPVSAIKKFGKKYELLRSFWRAMCYKTYLWEINIIDDDVVKSFYKNSK